MHQFKALYEARCSSPAARSAPATMRCARAYEPRFLWMWPNARISVMGGEVAASVLSVVRRESLKARGVEWGSAVPNTGLLEQWIETIFQVVSILIG